LRVKAADDKQLARFEALVDAADRGRLGFAELRELARAYRVQSARLALQRTRRSDPEALRYFNALCLRAYAHVYAVPPQARGRAFFWVRELPAALGRTARMQLLASALLCAGALLGARVALEDGANLAAIVPAAMYPESALHALWNSEAARREFLAPRDEKLFTDTVFAGSLFANNTRVGLLSLASGVLAAVPTVLLLLYNGLTLGGFGAIFMRGPEWLQFLAWIVPHAIPELLAIVLCSAGGLTLGVAVIAPGRVGRAVALRRAGADALLLFAASVPLLVVAALIESFVRQSLMSSVERFAVATLALLALWGYVRIARHFAREQGPDLRFLAADARHAKEA
jgi:uncharacterized membrane protein SpoIIM required for sporulation